jgi:hypothetical protein
MNPRREQRRAVASGRRSGSTAAILAEIELPIQGVSGVGPVGCLTSDRSALCALVDSAPVSASMLDAKIAMPL